MTLKDKEIKLYTTDEDDRAFLFDDVREAVSEFIYYKKSCLFVLNEKFDEYNPDEVDDYYEKKQHNKNIYTDLEKFKQIFGDFEK